MMPTMAVGYVTAYASAGSVSRSGAMPGSVPSVCVPAPSEGVFVEAPEKMPSTAAGSNPASQPMSGAVAAPEITIAAASTFIFTPCCRSAAKKPGPELQPDGEDEQDQPELLHEIERVMIHRLAEMPDENPRKQHARRAEPDAAKLQTPERHPHHAHEREHADGVRDRLRFVEFEEPAHVLLRSIIAARVPVRLSDLGLIGVLTAAVTGAPGARAQFGGGSSSRRGRSRAPCMTRSMDNSRCPTR